MTGKKSFPEVCFQITFPRELKFRKITEMITKWNFLLIFVPEIK